MGFRCECGPAIDCTYPKCQEEVEMNSKDITERLQDFARDYTTTTYHDDLICEAATEIDQLRQQLAERDAELKRINHAINDDRVDLTITAAEAITELHQQMTLLRDASQKLVDRWDSPLWKDQPHTANYIHALRETLAATEPKP